MCRPLLFVICFRTALIHIRFLAIHVVTHFYAPGLGTPREWRVDKDCGVGGFSYAKDFFRLHAPKSKQKIADVVDLVLRKKAS